MVAVVKRQKPWAEKIVPGKQYPIYITHLGFCPMIFDHSVGRQYVRPDL